ncbi:hypothetical protein MNBD_GAMMA12-247 [hydrothermal vent metagenome]|uniref:VWFA domain-containing protein n=1 Tax=hydrothermal vent metagenome TaxID=652676 RepID=A0A3B0Z6X1_9ZZZZ
MNFSTIEWQNPWCLSLVFVPAILFLFSRRGLSNLKRFAQGHLLPWLLLSSQASNQNRDNRQLRTMFNIRISLHFLLWLMLAIAAAGPRQADQDSQNRLIASVDIMVLLDISRSMKAVDVVPDRLSRARVEVLRLLEMMKGDRIGLIVFGGRSLLVMPPTRDKSVARFYVSRLSHIDLPVDGSNLLEALKLADKTFKTPFRLRNNRLSVISKRSRAVLLISDGGLSDQSQALVTQQLAKMTGEGTQLYTIGVGTVAGGAIPDSKTHWLHFNNLLVRTRLDEQWLRQLARIGQGRYAALRDDGSTLKRIYQQGIARQASYLIEAGKQKYVVWNELYFMPLLIAVLIIILLLNPLNLFRKKVELKNSIAMPTIKSTGPNSSSSGDTSVSVSKLSILLFISLLIGCSHSQQFSYDHALQAYSKQQFRQTLEIYNVLDLSSLDGQERFNARMTAGNSAYRLLRWNEAVSWYQRAFIGGFSQKQKAQALFNMANAWTKMQNYPVAISIYQDVLLYWPAWKRATINLALVKALYQNVKNDPGADLAITSRLGKGPRSRRAMPGLTLNKGSTSIDNNPEKKDKSLKGYEYDIENKNSINGVNRTSNKQLSLTNKLGKNRLSMNTLDQVNHLGFFEIIKKTADKKNSRILWRRLFFYENKLFIPQGERINFPNHQPW